MDYIEAFKNLKTNNKYGRKSPHKAVMMLTVIELYEQNLLSNNEIRYDDVLKTTFLNVWNKVLPDEPIFQPEAYFPFWFLQNDSFWHIVPKRGKEDILSLMRDRNVKPSEAKIMDSVMYVELDNDLFFLISLPSGRSSLKKVLLETYTSLSEEDINRISESSDNYVDKSEIALSDYEKTLSRDRDLSKNILVEVEQNLVRQFLQINEDIQIALNVEYFTFLKNHRNEREVFKDFCPTVYDLFDKIVNHPIKRGELIPAFAIIYDNFLSDLKISLMGEEDSMDILDKINEALDYLHGNNMKYEEQLPQLIGEHDPVKSVDKRDIYEKPEDLDINTEEAIPEKKTLGDRKGKNWSNNEDEHVELYYKQGKDTNSIAIFLGRSEDEVKSRLTYLGFDNLYSNQISSLSSCVTQKMIKYNNEEYRIENSLIRCSIFNSKGLRIFSSDGKLKYLGGKLYRLNLKEECFTLKSMLYNCSKWMKGEKRIVAYPDTELYRVLNNANDYSDVIEDIIDNPIFEDCQLKVSGTWYKYNGYPSSKQATVNQVAQNNDGKILNQNIVEKPYYSNRKQAVLHALGFFRLPVNVRDITRAISRTYWGESVIIERDVEEILVTLSEVESIDGKYILKKKR